jgi:hypothetical protein
MRQDKWANEVVARIIGVIEMHAAEAHYYVQCYNLFRVVSVPCPSVVVHVEEALR